MKFKFLILFILSSILLNFKIVSAEWNHISPSSKKQKAYDCFGKWSIDLTLRLADIGLIDFIKSKSDTKPVQVLIKKLDQTLSKATINAVHLNQLYQPSEKENLAFRFASHIRHLPELDFYRNGTRPISQLPNDLNRFIKRIPEGYTLVRDYSGPVVGLKYGLYEKLTPNENGKKEIVIAFAPTQFLMDWLSDLSFAIDQIEHREMDRTLELILNEYAEQNNGVDIILTGHSLGGGLAQGFAYRISQKNLKLEHPKNISIHAISFNSFGAKEQIEWSQRKFDPFVESQFYATHFYIQGDPVAGFGTHIGTPYGENSPSSTLRFTNNNSFGRNVHDIRSLSNFLRNSKENMPHYSQIEPFSINAPLARIVHQTVQSIKSSWLEKTSIQLAKEMIQLSDVYYDQSLESNIFYTHWLKDEILDLLDYFISTENTEGQKLLEVHFEKMKKRLEKLKNKN